jgi:hypothetical protein
MEPRRSTSGGASPPTWAGAVSAVDAGLQRGAAEVVRVGVRKIREEPAGGRLEHETLARHPAVSLGPPTRAGLVGPSGDRPDNTEGIGVLSQVRSLI